ncbi:MAG: NADH-quinone oxidoreductase subunit D, partial [Halothiobacillus sp.]|nr:NADH-quinone oxidoreductase subunit D [Halothiobacillus sp.]
MPHPEPPIERPFQMQILRPDELLDAAQTLLADHDVGLGDTPSAHGRMQCAYALRDADGKLSVRYIVSQGANRPWGIWSVDAASGSLPSLANVLP